METSIAGHTWVWAEASGIQAGPVRQRREGREARLEGDTGRDRSVQRDRPCLPPSGLMTHQQRLANRRAGSMSSGKAAGHRWQVTNEAGARMPVLLDQEEQGDETSGGGTRGPRGVHSAARLRGGAAQEHVERVARRVTPAWPGTRACPLFLIPRRMMNERCER